MHSSVQPILHTAHVQDHRCGAGEEGKGRVRVKVCVIGSPGIGIQEGEGVRDHVVHICTWRRGGGDGAVGFYVGLGGGDANGVRGAAIAATRAFVNAWQNCYAALGGVIAHFVVRR